MSIKKINLTQGKVALVDSEDYDYLNQWKWHAAKDKTTWYARTSYLNKDGNKRILPMHRLLLKCKEGKEVDHINHNGLDNRRSNLRICSTAENQHNQKLSKKNSSGFRGVYFHNTYKSWNAAIRNNGRKLHLGTFKTKTAAARAYDEAAKKYHGKFASLNFS